MEDREPAPVRPMMDVLTITIVEIPCLSFQYA
jgi:hypothetical protein